MIKNFSETQNMLKNYSTDGWSKSIESKRNSATVLEELKTNSSEGGRTFGEFLMDSISEVNSLQVEADKSVQKLASGETKNIHETLLAVEKAQIAFKTMNQVRSKVIDAYKEIMRMQV